MTESVQYEGIRNRAIMFFFEMLLIRDKPMNLHELSCSFGQKEFSSDMRQIVGHSQNGLRKFLMKFPSIFTIDGDFVQLNVNSDSAHAAIDNSCPNANKAIHRIHAIEYFANKLCQYGPKVCFFAGGFRLTLILTLTVDNYNATGL